MNEQYREWMPPRGGNTDCMGVVRVAKTGWGRLHSELFHTAENESPVCVGVFLSYRVFSLAIFRCAATLLFLSSQFLSFQPRFHSVWNHTRYHRNHFFSPSLPSSLPVSFFFFFGLKQHRILILSIEAPLFFPGVYNRFLSFPTRFRALEIILFDVNEYNA